MFWSQFGKFQPNDSEAVPGVKSKLSSLAHAYSECKVDSKEFSLTKEHMIALSNLKKNKNIVICKPDKGYGVVLDREDYNSKMLNILKDNNKFCALGKLPECDKTSKLERRLQTLLLNLKKSNQINETFYNLVRQTGAERPCMYGLPKIHKEGAPLRPILAMINSAQHELSVSGTFARFGEVFNIRFKRLFYFY
ncbi:uncharacterized protein LOC124453389 [Xenia sp. Carnegie-2017]|uniref:uncharacterized protein LOC124453389 n=1 Tax=Xenia sp. Carnegie-2017 TaxID=2897299 RepID=UPI001F036352|nr:uncharacterized protein LOC124453389 [Xenia sp. Carnegie-2017]